MRPSLHSATRCPPTTSELRRTGYDVPAAVARLRETAFPGIDEDYLDGALVAPLAPEWVTGYFEHMAGRGPDPGLERRVR